MDSKNFTIGVLSITAAVLLVGLIVVNVRPAPAIGAETSALSGDFTISVGRVTQDTEALYVIDNITQRMLMYGITRKTGEVGIVDQLELLKLPQ